MKKFISILFLLVSAQTNAANQEFIDFAVKQAHSQGFNSCDNAIRQVYSNAGGEDIRTNVSVFKESPKLLSMIGTWGSKGDTVFSKTTFINEGASCVYDTTSVITSDKSCLAYSQELSAFNYISETGDYIWLQNAGNVYLLLKPLGSGCIATFSRDGKA